MRNKNSYVLTININDNGVNNSPVAGEKKTQTNTTDKSIFTSYLVAKPFIEKTKQIIENNVQTQYANEELSYRVQLGLDLASKTAGIIAGIAGGQSLASMLGISTSMGSVIGAGVMVASYVMDIAVKQNQIDNAKLVENESLQVLRGRAGIQYNRSRSGE